MDAAPVLDLLILARAFVEAGWAQGCCFADAEGKIVSNQGEAVRYCLLGAYEAARCELREWGVPTDFRTGLKVLHSVLPHMSLPFFNDLAETTQADVLALFDAACERVGKS